MRVRLLVLGILIFGMCSVLAVAAPVINEVNWGGAPNDPQAEWIELYNPSDQPVNLDGWRLYSSDGAPNIRLHGTIAAHGYFLLERGRGDLLPGIHADIVYTGALRDSGEALFLVDSTGHYVDSANRSGGPWPAGTNLLGIPPCASMERINPTAPDNPTNWATSRKSGGTPDAQNSVYNPPPRLQSIAFTPSLPHLGERVLFTAEVKNNNATAFIWDFGDGTAGAGQTASHTYTHTGVYVVLLTVKGPQGAIAQQETTVRVIPARVILVDFSVTPPDSKQILQSGDPLLFSDESFIAPPGQLTEWTWKFGDGATASGQTASHTYARGGRYVITHTVIDTQGETATQTRSLLVHGRHPIAAFTHTPEHPNAGTAVTFNAAMSYDPDGTKLSYAWDFNGDGKVDLVSAVPTATYVYPHGGTYTVTLTVQNSDPDGPKQSLPVTAVVTVNYLPHPCFTLSSFSPHAGVPVTCTDCSSDPDSTITAWQWNFGDGTTATGSTPTHTYACAGKYTISLTVTDDNGAQATTSAAVTVQPSPPHVALTVQPAMGPTGTPVTFTASASTTCPTDKIVSYAWDFNGDGAYDQTTSSTSVTHTYMHIPTAQAKYAATVKVTDAAGLTAVSAPVTVTVCDRKPIAQFSTAPATPTDADTVQFTDRSTDPDGRVVAWEWSFGDGTNATVQTPSHRFPDEGTYTVTLVVTDDSGVKSAPATVQITVTNAPPIAHLTATPTHVLAGAPVQFDASGSHDQSPNGRIVHYAWDFTGSGTYTTVTTAPTVTHVYAKAGTYAATVKVTDDDGATATSAPVTINVDSLIADFSYQPPSPTDADTVTFTDQSVDPVGKIVSWAWNFGDGESADVQTPTHQFPDEGTYTVTLTVTDACGVHATASKPVIVANALPIAKLVAPATAVVGTPVEFYDHSYDPSPNGQIVHTAWDFGDGTTCPGTAGGCGDGSVLAPIHTYTAPGVYTVQLVVIDNHGGLARATAQITVRPPAQ